MLAEVLSRHDREVVGEGAAKYEEMPNVVARHEGIEFARID